MLWQMVLKKRYARAICDSAGFELLKSLLDRSKMADGPKIFNL